MNKLSIDYWLRNIQFLSINDQMIVDDGEVIILMTQKYNCSLNNAGNKYLN
jgi:hypothetical protein